MKIDLAGRVAVVTGGAQGIGAETARVLADAGARVAVWDQEREVHWLPDGGIACHVDVADRVAVDAAVERTLAEFGRLDILINNAGIIRDAQLVKVKDGEVVGQMAEADLDRVLGVNLKGVFHCTQAVVPTMIRQRWGRIVNAASVVCHNGNFGQTNYVAAKSGVVGMTRVWARELGRHGITVNAVAPGFIATDMALSVPPQVLDRMLERTPVGRLGTPREVAHAYLFLVSEQAGFVHGAVLNVDGGLVLGT